MDQINKIPTDERVNFNRSSVDMRIRRLESKINEVVDAINALNTPVYADDFDDDELEEMIKGGDTGESVFTPQEAKKILAERRRTMSGSDIIE